MSLDRIAEVFRERHGALVKESRLPPHPNVRQNATPMIGWNADAAVQVFEVPAVVAPRMFESVEYAFSVLIL
jgi:hypothetical protein